ncbi:hypothetical protein BDW74DRAFT_106664 [Aspergillus multicolor]|uniref:uncharacterized protein n=1 Tax=Aspergillus multicolor TaxID=41759 RepID=UPI003CCD37BF
MRNRFRATTYKLKYRRSFTFKIKTRAQVAVLQVDRTHFPFPKLGVRFQGPGPRSGPEGQTISLSLSRILLAVTAFSLIAQIQGHRSTRYLLKRPWGRFRCLYHLHPASRSSAVGSGHSFTSFNL